MQLGMIGLGRMGGNMAERLRRAGVAVVGYDRDPSVSDATDLADLVRQLEAPRNVWVMVPAGDPCDQVIVQLSDLLEADDLIVDGGNSRWTEDIRHSQMLAEKGIRFVDCGVSGGVWGLQNGYGLMAGGEDADIERLMPVLDALRPEGPRDEGFAHAGETGAGHFAKMVHNGIEYGLMQSWAEGYELLQASKVVTDVTATLKAWSRGTVVRSWLLDLLVLALEKDPELSEIKGWVDDSGEGRWTVEEAINHRVPMNAISAALYARFASRQDDSPAMKAVAALRNQFGGHAVHEVLTAGPTSGTGSTN